MKKQPKRIKIGVDIRDLRIAKAGTGTYLNEICSAFKRLDDDRYRFVFFDTIIPVYTGKNKFLKMTEHIRFQVWKQLILPFKAWINRCHIVFATDFFVPYIRLGYQTVPVFHDAFFYEYPDHYNKVWLWLFRKTAIPAAKKASFVVVPTRYAMLRVAQYFKIESEKLKIVGEGPKTFKKNTHESTVLKRYGLDKQSYLLHIGTLDKRKNIKNLIHAYKIYRDAGFNHKLLLAGKTYPKQYSNDFEEIRAAIRDNDLGTEVILTGYVEDDDLPSLYENAWMYVFPSINEGFGIPVIEAFTYGLPVLVADNTSLPEVGGHAVITFDPFDVTDMAKKMILISENEQLRAEVIKKGYQRAESFSWDKAAYELTKLFNEIYSIT